MMNTPRQNIEAALSGEGAEHFAAVICYEGIYIRDHWAQLTHAPWPQQHSPDLNEQLAWRADVLARSGYDWFELPGRFHPREERADINIQTQPDGCYWVNTRSGQTVRLHEPQVSGWGAGHRVRGEVESIRPAHLAQTPDEIDQQLGPALTFDLATARASGSDDLARAMIVQQPHLFPLGYVAAPLWRTYHLWGFEGMMEMIATRPELVRHACEHYQVEALCAIRVAAWLGAAAVWIEDCLTDMIHPRDFAALNLPTLHNLVDEIHAAGMLSIHYFCGNPAGKWDALLATGADALALEESKKGFNIDIAEVAERVYGRCALLGNLDAIGVLQEGDEAHVRAEVQRQCAAGVRNRRRFVMSTGSPVTPGTPVDRVRQYCDLVHELG